MDLEYINIGNLNDFEVAAHMRKYNYEKFKTLVRMHLSFELDLNTDEFDLPCHEIVYEDKGKVKKWNRLSKKHKHNAGISSIGCTSSSKSTTSTTTSPTDTLQQQIDSGFMFHLKELKEFLLLEENITQEGIFRKSGSILRQNELRQQMQQNKLLNLEEDGYTAHDCASIFKGYLAELNEPLLTDAHYPAHLQIEPLCTSSTIKPTTTIAETTNNTERQKREQHLLSSVQLLLLLLPDDNRQLFTHIIEMLHAVVEHETLNKMSANNLATLFTPHLICPRNLPPEALHYVARKMSNIIAYMIIKGLEIFDVPAKLSTDIRAYYVERKRKKTMSPEQMLDESISDISTVNTVYTFVNREMTAAAHHTNTTETELAQLYAHIQSLPESSRKRRLIKQFNKQNGQGTPLQFVALNRLKNTEGGVRSAKSIGDSIKKHIFHKGLMSRTPKRHAAATMTMPSIDTPNLGNNKNPKMRVLFQSPASNNSSSSFIATETTKTNTTACSTITKCSAASSLTLSHSTTNTPLNLKLHSLQKSKSSISLLKNSTKIASQRVLHNPVFTRNEPDYSNSSNSNSSCSESSCSLALKQTTSAPVSRQTSSELDEIVANTSAQQLIEPSCCVTPLKLITDAAKQLISGGSCASNDAADVAHGTNLSITEKKTVAWHDKLYDIDEYSNPSTPLHQSGGSDIKSRYKSEPNLSRILAEKSAANQDVATPINNKTASKSLTRKLIKGVSMGNLRFGFGSTDSTKLLMRGVSATLKKCADDNNTHSNQELSLSDQVEDEKLTAPLLKHMEESDLDDDAFEDDPNDHIDDDDTDVENDDNADSNDNASHTESENELLGNYIGHRDHANRLSGDCYSNSNSNELPGCSITASYQHLLLQQSGLYRNLNLITSTPSFLLGRRSMSPITKSTQRMPKYMQESIMTPRSRKPVMVMTATTSVDKHVDVNAHDEVDDEVDDEDGDVVHDNHVNDDETKNELSLESKSNENDALSTNFKHYLLKRSVFSASPVDSSFSSQPDDFVGDDDDNDHENENENSAEMEALNASKLSATLLYCLDGNKPGEIESTIGIDIDDTYVATMTMDINEQAEDTLSTSDDPNTTNTNTETETKTETETEINIQTTPNVSFDQKTSSSLSEQTSQERLNILRNQNNRINRLSTNPFIILNNARKRAATTDLEKHPQIFVNNASMSTAATHSLTTDVFNNLPANTPTSSNNSMSPHAIAAAAAAKNAAAAITNPTTTNKENLTSLEGYLLTKKLLISKYPGETKF